MKPNAQEVVEDGIYFIPRKEIHPDPEQPRVSPDDELQASIDEQGIITPILVRPHPEIENEWMIVDGERRWRGAVKLSEIPCRIRLDLEGPVDRLITQLSANTGKPLSPIEQAKAFKKILDGDTNDTKLSQAVLAKMLGIARSTIGDRIRLIEIHPAWMKLIESGRLQVSHAPLIHQYRAVPDDYQVKAAKTVSEGRDWTSRKYGDEQDVIPVAEMRKVLHSAFRDYVIRLDKVRAYKGPVLEIEEEQWSYGPGGNKIKKVKYAADIKLWRPIRNAAERRRRKENPGLYGRSSASSTPRARPIDVAVKLIGDRVKVKKTTSWQIKAGPGEIEIFESDGWASGLDPQVLSEQLGAEDLVIRESEGGTKKIFTTNSRAVELSQQSFERNLLVEVAPNLKKIREKLTPELLGVHEISGPGVRTIAAAILMGDSYDDADTQRLLRTVALAIADRNLPDNASFSYNTKVLDVLKELKDYSDETLGAILTALAAALTLKGGLPDCDEMRDEIAKQTAAAKFSFRDAEPPKSKKQQKREARAAGKQVGDPSRKKNMRPGSGRQPTGPLVKVGESLGVDVVRDATPEEIEAGELVEA